MERTWKLTAAGILCIIGGIIGVVPGIAAALFLALIGGGWLGAIGGLPLIILGTIAIVGGIYAFKRRIWRLALAGSICALIGFVILVIVGIFIMLMLVSDNPEVFPFGGTIFDAYAIFLSNPYFAGFIVGFGILGILPIIFIIRGKREFEAHEFNKAIELNPDNADAYYKRGDAYSEIGDYDKAIADYNEAIELNPSDALAYYNRGLDYHNKGEVLKAVSDLEKCIGLSTDRELTKAARQALHKIENSP